MKLEAKQRLSQTSIDAVDTHRHQGHGYKPPYRTKPDEPEQWYVKMGPGDYAGYGNGPDAEKKARAAAKKDGGTVKWGRVPD